MDHTRALDLDCAHLYGDITEEVQGHGLNPPLGMTVSLPAVPGKEVGLDLCKTLYGSRFSGRQWFLKLHTFLLRIGFRPSTADPCIYIRNTKAN
jgi:hypothetical protein